MSDERRGDDGQDDDAPSNGTSAESASDSDPFVPVDTPAKSPFDEAKTVFEHTGPGSIDPDRVWERLTAMDDGRDGREGDGDGREGDGDDDGSDVHGSSFHEDGRYSEVSKHRFCKQCEHFSAPPAVECNHESAEIVEFLDMETVRLRNCPVVDERKTLERSEQ